ncbi:MAG: imidazole glycerol phosphate synthase subunit HisH [Bacteroidota bacterium]
MIAVIDYGSGNIKSVTNALNDLRCEYIVTNREKEICDAEKIIFPGVGEASFAVKRLHVLNLFTMLRVVNKPMLGICLGMQLLCEKSLEGNAACLGVFPGSTEIFDGKKVKVPHMGWNKVKIASASQLFKDIPDETFFYFAHSYYVPINSFTIASADYGNVFSAAVEKGNYYGVQFHPEKSGKHGIQLLKNFIEL